MSVVHVGGGLGEQTFHLDNGRRWFPRGNLGQRVIRNLDGYWWPQFDLIFVYRGKDYRFMISNFPLKKSTNFPLKL